MKNKLLTRFWTTAVSGMCVISVSMFITACGGGQNGTSTASGGSGNSEASADDPSRWAPSDDAKKEYEQWKAQAQAAGVFVDGSGNPTGIVGQAMQPTAADQRRKKQLDRQKLYEQAGNDPEYNLNPRAWEEKHGLANSDADESAGGDDGGAQDEMPKAISLPPLAQGDEADQYGLPEFEKIARGELHVRRIQY